MRQHKDEGTYEVERRDEDEHERAWGLVFGGNASTITQYKTKLSQNKNVTRNKRKNKKKNGSCPKCGRNNGKSIDKKKRPVKQPPKKAPKKTIKKPRPVTAGKKVKGSKPVGNLTNSGKNSFGKHKKVPRGRTRTKNVQKQISSKKKGGNLRKGRRGTD